MSDRSPAKIDLLELVTRFDFTLAKLDPLEPVTRFDFTLARPPADLAQKV
jgi:hypothetical protein